MHKNLVFVLIVILAFTGLNCSNKKQSFDIHDYTLTKARAHNFSKIALRSIQQEFPYKDGHVIENAADLHLPKVYHPAFYGSFDWHSAVHGHWLLVHILKEFSGELDNEEEIRSVLNNHFTAENLQQEANYFDFPNSKSFERTYGWAWLLKLAEELHTMSDDEAQVWYKNLQPLVEVIVERYINFLPKQTYPIRRGVHPNTAFGLAFALDYAETVGNEKLQKVLQSAAQRYFGDDKNYPVNWEVEGDAFLSSSLMEASLMTRLMADKEYAQWLEDFLPDLFSDPDHVLLFPAEVTDRSDPKIGHLDGLNLSRAWCMAKIAEKLPAEKHDVLKKAIIRHFQYSLPAVDSEHYEGSHWLASFAVYALKNTEIYLTE